MSTSVDYSVVKTVSARMECPGCGTTASLSLELEWPGDNTTPREKLVECVVEDFCLKGWEISENDDQLIVESCPESRCKYGV